MDFSNVNPDAKGYVAPVVSNVELEDIHKPPVQPVPEDGESDNVKLDEKALHGRKSGGGEQGKSANEEDLEEEIPQDEALTHEQLQKIVQEIKHHFQKIGSNFTFHLHADPQGDKIAELRNSSTNQVIKHISLQEVLRLHEKLQDMTGLLFDKEI
jgi:uncharacterized FlaG/YvyC family protein